MIKKKLSMEKFPHNAFTLHLPSLVRDFRCFCNVVKASPKLGRELKKMVILVTSVTSVTFGPAFAGCPYSWGSRPVRPIKIDSRLFLFFSSARFTRARNYRFFNRFGLQINCPGHVNLFKTMSLRKSPDSRCPHSVYGVPKSGSRTIIMRKAEDSAIPRKYAPGLNLSSQNGTERHV